MKFIVEQDDNVVILSLGEKRLDASIAADLKGEFLILCNQPNIDALIIDLSKVEFCDSSGLSALLLAHRQLEESEAPVILTGANKSLQNLLSITRLDRVFPMFATREDALADMQEEGTDAP